MASDPNLDITGFLYRSLDFLRKELSYSGTYKPSSSDTRPDKLSDADKRRSELGLPTRDERPSGYQASPSQPVQAVQAPAPAPGLSASGGPAGFGGNTSATGQSLPGGVSGAQRKSEYAQPIPGPGTPLGLSDADTSGQYPGARASQVQAPQVQPTYSPQASTQAYSDQAVQQLLAQQAQVQSQSAPVSAPDSYLSQISDTSLEVLEHFGAEAPALLNQYACAVEDALIEQVQRGQDMHLMLNAAGEERAAMNIMLTDPDVLY